MPAPVPAPTHSPFSDPDAVARYAEGPPRNVPGWAAVHPLTDLLLSERAPDDARVLVLGAGGGLELAYLADRHPGWRFDGVDPSRPMLDLAARTLGAAAGRATLHEGVVDAAPEGPFDAATCLLTLHFVPAVERLRTLGELHRRLRPGAPLVVLHHSVPAAAPEERDRWFARQAAFAAAPGAEPETVRATAAALAEQLPVLDPAEDERLLRDAGFGDVEQVFHALTFRGWVATA